MTDEAKNPPGVWFWLAWVLGSGAAFTTLLLLGFTVSTAMLGILGYEESDLEVGGPFTFYLTVAFAFGGAGIGIVQWLLLRRRINRAGWWVLSWMVGMSLVSLISIALEDLTSEAVSELVHNGLAGLVVGLIHYFVLKDQREWAAVWLVAIVASFVAAGAAAFALTTLLEDFEGASYATLVGMAISGFVMVQLLRRPAKQEPDRSI
jgi:hypothetical protein